MSPYFEVRSQSFNDAWIEALDNAVNYGKDITFGSEKEPKKARDTDQTIILTGPAIAEIEAGIAPPGFGLKKGGLEAYTNEFNRDWYEEYRKLPPDDMHRFSYVYFERLVDTYGDQLLKLRELLARSIKSGIASNRHQAITWSPTIDMENDSPPCFQRVWIRYYHPGIVDMHLSWRSRDLLDAWPGNEIGIVPMMNREVFFPNNCRIGRIIDQNDSLHVYHGRLQQAMNVLKEEEIRNPALMRRLKQNDY
ncbi:MAG: hypothetical protein PHO90_02680 [Candidatus Pacebacteria bacterium]|nr:hypothetical protein [Candidatus Paceibacterota bacterium]